MLCVSKQPWALSINSGNTVNNDVQRTSNKQSHWPNTVTEQNIHNVAHCTICITIKKWIWKFNENCSFYIECIWKRQDTMWLVWNFYFFKELIMNSKTLSFFWCLCVCVFFFCVYVVYILFLCIVLYDLLAANI